MWQIREIELSLESNGGATEAFLEVMQYKICFVQITLAEYEEGRKGTKTYLEVAVYLSISSANGGQELQLDHYYSINTHLRANRIHE